jgi:hypothetical protein
MTTYNKVKYVIYINEAYPFYNEEKFMGRNAAFSDFGILQIRTGKPDEKGYYHPCPVHRSDCIFVYEGEGIEEYAEYLI